MQPGPVAEQFRKLEQQVPGSIAQPHDGGSYLITVPNQKLVPGWTKPATTIHFLVTAGFPQARPDCFWADEDLRLSSGTLPQNSAIQSVAGLGQRLWFSFHPQTWDPSRDTLLTYLRVIRRRLHQAV